MQGSVVDNRYDVERPLGSGGMGEVYLARDMTLGRDVALKLLRSQFANDRDSAERFKREALSAARLSHPNIVQVYDRGDTEDGTSYIAMEYVPGGTLKDRITQEGPLDAKVAASYGYQVAGALGAAHDKGLVHRDIKPQNVLITENGEAKVADFGIARAVSAATGSQTQTGTILGTAGYMSPEQALGKPATPKSDLYSLGVVLYEALTGGLPFTAENPIAVSMKHVNEPPVPPQALNPTVPDGMNDVVLKLLAKDPDDRYEGAEALAEDLWRARSGSSPAAAAPIAGETRTVQTPRRPAPTVRRAAPARSPARRKRRGTPLILFALLLLLLGLLGTAWALAGSPSGTSNVEVPDVDGLPRDEAVTEIESAGFGTEILTARGPASEEGVVIRQSPSGGEGAREGSVVTLTVGGGPGAIVVPEVVGLNVAEAETRLEGAGLAVGFTREVPGDSAAGVVVSQGVPAGNEVNSGTEVALDISSGPAQPTTPTSSASASASQGAGADASASASASAGADEEAGNEAERRAREAEKAREEAGKEAEKAAREQARAAEKAAKEAEKRAEERAEEAGED